MPGDIVKAIIASLIGATLLNHSIQTVDKIKSV